MAAESLRTLLLYDCIYPDARGGVEHRNALFAQAFAQRGHHVCLAGFANRSLSPSPGVEVRSLGLPQPLYDTAGRRSPGEAVRLARAIARLDLREFDLVEAASLPYLHLLPLERRCRRLGIPLVVNWHAYWGSYWRVYQGGLLWPLAAAIERWATERGTMALAVSRMTAACVGAHRRRSPVEVVPNGIPNAMIATAAAQGVPGAALLFAGRLIQERRLPILLEAIDHLRRNGQDVRLTIVGDGPDRAALESRCLTLGITEWVEFKGSLESADLWRTMGGARIAVQPSSRDSFGMFPLEAMAAGLPVVHCLSADSAIPELVRDGREGFGVQADPVALAAVLSRLLGDESERRALAAKARERAAEFDWASVAERVEALYRAVLSATAGTPRVATTSS
jgi:glycosyltransferase involved in cell wall biosynthesis